MSRLDALRSQFALPANRSFRRLLAGRATSFLGDGLFTVAVMWLVFELTGSTTYTGLAGFLLRAPNALKVFAGPLVDRSRLGRVLVGSELLGAALALLVPLAALSGELSVWIVLGVLPFMALTELFAAPAQTAALPRIVDRESLVRANSAFSVVTSAVDAGAQALGGALVAAVGAVALYAVDAATYAVAAVVFLGVSIPAAEGADDESDPLDLATYRRELREGIAVLTGSVLGLMLLASLLANFLTSAAFAVLPAYAAAISGAAGYGLLLGATTAGAIVGSLLAPGVEDRPLGVTNAVGLTLAGGLWIAGVELGGVAVTAALFAASRVPIGVYNVGVQATMQTGVPEDRLGRVTATVSSLSNVVGPFGLLLGGVAGDAVGATAVLLGGGVGIAATGLLWGALPSLRRFGAPTAVRPGAFG
ncbi:MFS transporter [Halolamina sediminis]|uniref:MFS transporter n=1 Tax=Halolamina sediminis TaxID=1480675 RepID=UPI0013791A8E|nr:MFS transporter [Halolamina sediminis]